MTTRIEEGERRAAEVVANLTAAERARYEAILASLPTLLERTFIGPPVEGRQELFIVTEAELAEFRATELKEAA